MKRLNRLPSRSSKHSTRGQSLVEFALVLPILLIMVFGIIEFGMGLRSYISLTNATREGARFASVGNAAGAYPANCDGVDGTTVVGRVCVSIEGLDRTELDAVSVAYPNGTTAGGNVEVSAQYTYNYITPLGDILNFFTGGTFPDFLSLSTSTDMRLE